MALNEQQQSKATDFLLRVDITSMAALYKKKGRQEEMREIKFYDILTVFSDTQIFCQVFVTISLMKIHFRSSNEKRIFFAKKISHF
jgi:hypothetical protein